MKTQLYQDFHKEATYIKALTNKRQSKKWKPFKNDPSREWPSKNVSVKN